MNKLSIFLIVVLIQALNGCSRSETGPVEVKWDRDACERCRMVLSDRKHAAQIRGGSINGKRAKIYKFDDIGGAIVWLDKQPWKNEPTTELWVTDHRDGRWIDGYTAVYLSGQMTPMDFGYGAQDESSSEGVNYQQAYGEILKNESIRQGTR